jgi:antitoxin FitA
MLSFPDMAQALIRNLDDDLLEAYRVAARRNGRSLEAELRAGLQKARPRVRKSPEELIALSRRLRAMTPPHARQEDSTAYIRWLRDTNGRTSADEADEPDAGS